MRTQILIILLFSIFSQDFSQENPFVCDGSIYVSSEKKLYELQVNWEQGGFVAIPFPGEFDYPVNAIGYNPVDNFIYGIGTNGENNFLTRIDANGNSFVVDTLFFDNELDSTISPGDIDVNGIYYFITGLNQPPFTSYLFSIDLNSGNYVPEQNQIETSTPNIGYIKPQDIAINPLNQNAIGFSSILVPADHDVIYSLDLNTYFADESAFSLLTPGYLSFFVPSLFYDAYGNLYGQSGNELGLIDILTGEIEVAITDSNFWTEDACSCPYTIKMQKTVNPETTFPCTEVEYTLKISNFSKNSQNNITITDILPEGFVATALTRNPYGGIITGIGTDTVQI